MTIAKVYADFQNLDDSHRLRLTCAGTRADLERQGVTLHEGLHLLLYMDDADAQGRPDELRADGVVHFNQPEQCWVAAIDWSGLRHASDENAPNPAAEKASAMGDPQEPSLPENHLGSSRR